MARPKPTGWKARATWHGLSSPCRGGGRRAEDWPTEHTEHTEGFLTGGNGVIGGRRLAAKRRRMRKNRWDDGG